jgi:hypothetical protein
MELHPAWGTIVEMKRLAQALIALISGIGADATDSDAVHLRKRMLLAPLGALLFAGRSHAVACIHGAPHNRQQDADLVPGARDIVGPPLACHVWKSAIAE